MYSERMMTSSDAPHPLTGYLIWHISMRWRTAVDRALAPLGLTHAQYAMLASLHGLSRTGARPSQRELADFSGLEPMYISKLARIAERAGQLERQENSSDPRAVQLILTDRGVATVVAAKEKVRELHEQLLAPLGAPGDARRAQLTESLHALLQQARMLDSEDVTSIPIDPSP